MSHYIPRRKLIKEIQKRQQLHQKWLSSFASIKQTIYKFGEHIHKRAVKIRSGLTLFNLKSGLVAKFSNKASIDHCRINLSYLFNIKFSKKYYIYVKKGVCDFYRIFLGMGEIWWKLRFYIIFVFAFVLTINNIIYANKAYKKYNQTLPIRDINIFPAIPDSWLSLSQLYFLHNQEKDAQKALAQAKKYYLYYPPIINFGLFGKEIQNTEKMLLSPQQRRAQLLEDEKLLQKYPYSWQLWAIKARYEKELYLEEQFQNSITKLEWLYPKNEVSSQLLK